MALSRLSPLLRQQLETIEPSLPADWAVYPCAARLKTGAILPRVYFAEPTRFPFANHSALSPADISEIMESPERLLAHFARERYQAGESGMGYMAFKVVFRPGLQFRYLTGNLVDFIEFPLWFGPEHVKGVLPNSWRSRRTPNARGTRRSEWCFFST